MSPLRVLLVDDDPEFVRHFRVLGEGTFEVSTTAVADEALRLLSDRAVDAVLLDIDLGGGPDGIDLLARIRRHAPDIPVIMISGDDHTGTVVRAMRAGADDYVSKSPDLELLRLKIRKALDDAAWKIHARQIQAAATSDLIGSSHAMTRLREEIAQVAPRNLRVLIRGETGTGKERVAAALHAGSARRDGRFVTLSGAVGSDDLFDSELFGHERGSFTGAERRRVGKFELAAGGTLFLDEIDRLGRGRQAKLLRVVESNRFERIGGSEDVSTDARLVAATNSDLERAMASGAFLEDLYYRVAEYVVRVPPLRDRLGDLPELTAYLLARYARSEGVPPPDIDAGVFDVLRAHPWPGNVRELDGVLKRAAVVAGGNRVTADDVTFALRQGPRPSGSSDPQLTPRLTDFMGGAYGDARARLERAFDLLVIDDALRQTGGNVSRAARRLGLSRATLHRRIADLGLDSRSSGVDSD